MCICHLKDGELSKKKRYHSILKRATETRATLNLVLFAIMLMSTVI